MDEIGVFFEMEHDYTIEVKGKKHVGKFSSGKDKERVTVVVTACSDGRLLPPLFIFKASKPRNKTFKDDPPNPSPKLPNETEVMIKKAQAKVIHNYSAWMNQRTMVKHYIPFYQKFASASSLLIFDNCSAHVSDDTIKYLESKTINYIPLAANTTSISQPIDFSIGRSIKSKIRSQFDDWLEQNFDEIVQYDEVKEKYRFMAPDKSLIIKWTLKAYEEIEPSLVKKGNLKFIFDF